MKHWRKTGRAWSLCRPVRLRRPTGEDLGKVWAEVVDSYAKNLGQYGCAVRANLALSGFHKAEHRARHAGLLADLFAAHARFVDDVGDVHAMLFTLCEF